MTNWYGRCLGVLLVVAGCALTATPAGAAPAPAPQLSIAVANGHTTARTGESLEYRISVRNLGSTAVSRLVISQSVPAQLHLDSSTPSATPRAGKVSWQIALKAHATTTLRTSMTVRAVPPDLLRLATVACAAMSAGASPLVCAAHSDQLPAGAVRTADREGAVGGHRTWLPRDVGLGVGLALAVLAAAALTWRRTRSHRSPPGTSG